MLITRQARNVKVGDQVETSTGMRSVVRIDQDPLMPHVTNIVVDDVAGGPPKFESRLTYQSDMKVNVKRGDA